MAAPAARSSLLSQTVVAKAAAAAAQEAATEAVAHLRFIRGSPLKVRFLDAGARLVAAPGLPLAWHS